MTVLQFPPDDNLPLGHPRRARKPARILTDPGIKPHNAGLGTKEAGKQTPVRLLKTDRAADILRVMTKSRDIGRGGYQPGGGRPKGSKDRHPRKRRRVLELLPKLAEEVDELRLYGLLRRIRDESLDPKYRDFLRIAVLPCLHPRAFSRMTAKPSFMMTDDKLKEVRQAELEHERQVAAGRGQIHLIKEPR